jgi:16S rRNA (uracil1498-N3)-methyltransferase
MTRRRWIADEVHENRAALTGAHAQHLAQVLRARVGQEFDIAASDVVRRGRILSVSDSRVEFELGEVVPTAPLPQITLLLAIFKFDRMEWAIEKCTELGVSRIVPVIARRTDAHLAAAAAQRSERWQRLTRQAAEQSRRAGPPDLSPPIKIKEAVQIQAGIRILLAEHEHQVSLTDALASHVSRQTVALAIGPEGGWTDDEVQAFSATGWIPATLGHTILRAETAAIAALAIAQSAL